MTIESPAKGMSEPTVGVVLLAAGSSRRFGPENKLLALYEGRPLVSHVARALAQCRLARIVVVTGPDAALVEAALAGHVLSFAHNADHAQGIGGSIARGVEALGEGIGGIMIVQGDMPGLTPGLIESLMAAFRATGASRIVHPVLADGRQRSPVLWPMRYRAALLALTGDQGAKALIRQEAGHVTPVAVADPSLLADIDTVDELEALGRGQSVVES